MRFPLRRNGKALHGTIEGPSNPIKETGPMKIDFQITPNGADGTATLEIEGKSHALKRDEYSPWIQLTFRAGMGVNVRGVARFRITATEPEYSVYVHADQSSIPKVRRCRFRIRHTTPLTSPSCSAPTRRWGWPRTPGRSMSG